MTLPGYDAWLTHDPRDRDYGPCDECGHDIEEHNLIIIMEDGPSIDQGCSIDGCTCMEFIEGDGRE